MVAVKLYDRLRPNVSTAELLRHLNAVLDEEGDDRNREKRYGARDLYPGAVLIGWQVTPEEQLAFGFGHGRRIVVIGVIDTDGYDTYVDEDFAVDLATTYAVEHRLLRRPLPPTYVVPLSATDLPDWLDPDEVRYAFEDVASEMANERAAESHSYLDDQTALDLEHYGYDDQSAFRIATFGDAVAVNGEALMSPEFARELGVKGERGNVVVFWAEGLHAFYRWLTEHGYREVGELGGAWPGSDEVELQLDHVARQVAEVLGASESTVEDILRSQNDERDQIYWSSSSGEIEVYAVPRDDED